MLSSDRLPVPTSSSSSACQSNPACPGTDTHCWSSDHRGSPSRSGSPEIASCGRMLAAPDRWPAKSDASPTTGVHCEPASAVLASCHRLRSASVGNCSSSPPIRPLTSMATSGASHPAASTSDNGPLARLVAARSAATSSAAVPISARYRCRVLDGGCQQ